MEKKEIEMEMFIEILDKIERLKGFLNPNKRSENVKTSINIVSLIGKTISKNGNGISKTLRTIKQNLLFLELVENFQKMKRKYLNRWSLVF
jgi:hypothetical protein